MPKASKEVTPVEEIEQFVKKHEMAEWRFGRLAMNDPDLIPQLRAGRSLTLRSLTKIKTFMREYR